MGYVRYLEGIFNVDDGRLPNVGLEFLSWRFFRLALCLVAGRVFMGFHDPKAFFEVSESLVLCM